MIPLYWFLALAVVLFCIGLFGVLTRRNNVSILMGIELMINASVINFLAFWRYLYAPRFTAPGDQDGLVMALIVIVVAAAETAVGLALIISAYRRKKSVIVDDLEMMKG